MSKINYGIIMDIVFIHPENDQHDFYKKMCVFKFFVKHIFKKIKCYYVSIRSCLKLKYNNFDTYHTEQTTWLDTYVSGF